MPDSASALKRRAGAKRAPLGRPAKLPVFIPPQLATLVDLAPAGDEWLHEIKFVDGCRMAARLDRVSAVSRAFSQASPT
jgi:bifunctional non-homologous end joining protein LigD